MPKSRREFLTYSSIGLLGTAIQAQVQAPPAQNTIPPPGAPPAFGTSTPVGPEVSPATFAEAEKLVQAEMTAADRAQAEDGRPHQNASRGAFGRMDQEEGPPAKTPAKENGEAEIRDFLAMRFVGRRAPYHQFAAAQCGPGHSR